MNALTLDAYFIASNLAQKHLIIKRVGQTVEWCYRAEDYRVRRGASLNSEAAKKDAEIASGERALTFEEIDGEGDSSE